MNNQTPEKWPWQRMAALAGIALGDTIGAFLCYYPIAMLFLVGVQIKINIVGPPEDILELTIWHAGGIGLVLLGVAMIPTILVHSFLWKKTKLPVLVAVMSAMLVIIVPTVISFFL